MSSDTTDNKNTLSAASGDTAADTQDSPAVEVPVKRGPGRPRKDAPAEIQPDVKRRRGRPRLTPEEKAQREQKKKDGRGGSRPGAGRKPLGQKAMDASIIVRCETRLKDVFLRLGASAWIRSLLSEIEQAQQMSPQPAIEQFARAVALDTTKRLINLEPGASKETRNMLPPVEHDLNALLLKGKSSVYMLRATRDDMIDAGIRPGDLLLIDKSRMPEPGEIVVMRVNDEFIVRRFNRQKNSGTPVLAAENKAKDYPKIAPNDNDTWTCFGVLMHSVRSFVDFDLPQTAAQ